jgi:voltage-gated sodium channel
MQNRSLAEIRRDLAAPAVHRSSSAPLAMMDHHAEPANITQGFERVNWQISLLQADIEVVARNINPLMQGLKEMNSRYEQQLSENRQIRQVLMEIKAGLPQDLHHWTPNKVQQRNGDGIKFFDSGSDDSDPSLEFVVPDELPKQKDACCHSIVLHVPLEQKKDQTRSDVEEDDVEINADRKVKIAMAADFDVDSNETPLQLREEEGISAVFAENLDPEAPAYHVEDFYYKTGLFQAIARSKDFGNLTLGIVVLNAIYMGIDSDLNQASNIYDADLIFQICTQAFSLYFVFELTVRFLAFENKMNCLADGWFKFDVFLVISMIVDMWILMPVLNAAGDNVVIPTQPLRMLRLFKLSRMARLMKHFPELITMIKGLARSLRAIASSMVLLGLMVYTWAILIHMLLKGDNEFNKHVRETLGYEFTKVGDCVWTLIMGGTLMLDNAAPLMTELLFNKDIMKVMAGLAFMSYAFFSALLILQMLIGVLCDVVSQVGQERRIAESVGLVRQELLGSLQKMDNGDGKLTLEEFKMVLDTQSSKKLLKKLKVNRLFLTEIMGMMYPDATSAVPIRVIMEMLLMCRGDNPCTVQIISSALCFLSNEISEMQEHVTAHTSSVHNGHLERSSSKKRGLMDKCVSGDF